MATPSTGKAPLPEEPPREESAGAPVAVEPIPAKKPAIQKILEELRREHANLCAAIEALESLTTDSTSAPPRRRAKPIDDSWIAAARVARTKSPAPEDPATADDSVR